MRPMSRLVSVLPALLLCASTQAEFAAPFNLRCEYRVNPLGIDSMQPRLAWNLGSARRGQLQSAYQILAASSQEVLAEDKGDLWDSGRVDSDDAIQIAYGGAPLRSYQQCWWKVRAWNQDGKPSPWSEPAHWTMGVLDPADWSGAQWVGMSEGEAPHPLTGELNAAGWIWHPGDHPESSAKPGTAYFRNSFELPEGGGKAVCLLAADNQATLFVNGKRVGDWGNFSTAGEFDITEHLRPGGNVLAVSVQNMGDGPNPAGLMALVHMDTVQGGILTATGDGTWRSADTAQSGWEKPDFDETAWDMAQHLGPNGMEPWKAVRLSEPRILPARMLRREFDLDQPVRRAAVYFSGLGLSELYLNGAKVGDAVLSPGCTEYDKRVFYVSHEVTDRLNAGKNALGVWLGNGRYYAPRLTEPTKTLTFDYPAMLLLLRMEMADGSVRTLVSDPSWKLTADGPIRANNEYDGEVYDARMELPGWAAPGFDDAAWRAAEAAEAPGGVLSAEMMEPIRVTELVTPIALTNPAPGVYIYDMGQNMVGWTRMTVRGPKGATVRQRHAEVLKEDGTLYLDNIRGAKVTNEYTLKGEGVETYEPRFTYHGFRYLEITGHPGEPVLADITGCVVHDDVAPAGAFHCSDKLVNKIAKNIQWGVRGNYRSMPTDCPQRDERQGWLGDRSAECQGETYLYDISALYAKWVCDMEDGQKESGSVSDVCPSYWPLYNDNVTWPSSFIIIPSMLRRQYGDTRAAERHYDGMKKWITHMSGYIEDGIMPRDNYGDWCVPPEEQHLIHSKDPARKTPGDFLATAYFIYDLNLMAGYAADLGKTADADAFKAQAAGMLAAFNKKFLDEKKAQYANGTETSCVLPLAFGLVPEKVRKPLFDRLVTSIMDKGKGHLSTGLVGGQWLMRVLNDNGRPDVAWTLASQSTYPSWGYMVGKNATTVWELWNGDTADPAMNSGNHVMLVGDLNIWLYEHVAGIRPAAPGFKRLLLDPVAPEGLDFAEASHRSPYGQVFSRWEKKDGKFVWRVTIPANTTAEVRVPAKDAAKVTESGVSAAQADGLKFVKMDNGAAVFEAGSGTYQFEVEG